MNLEAYYAARKDPSGAAVGEYRRSWLRMSGRDRQTFLNGQISNDVLHLQPGRGVHACLLNNTGHLVANIYVHALPQEFWIEVNSAVAATVLATLSRFIIREDVEIEDVTPSFESVTVQGHGARGFLSELIGMEIPDEMQLPLTNTRASALGSVALSIIQHAHTPTSSGFDLIVPSGEGRRIQEVLLAMPGAAQLDAETFEVLRIEAGIPRWGYELDERVIPLEANLFSAINQNKGCYLGQEVIARILSRGHTNRSLVGLRLSRLTDRNQPLRAEPNEESGRNTEIGRLTSVADSPDAGLIALGYVRNEFIQIGNTVYGDTFEATVAPLPFVS